MTQGTAVNQRDLFIDYVKAQQAINRLPIDSNEKVKLGCNILLDVLHAAGSMGTVMGEVFQQEKTQPSAEGVTPQQVKTLGKAALVAHWEFSGRCARFYERKHQADAANQLKTDRRQTHELLKKGI